MVSSGLANCIPNDQEVIRGRKASPGPGRRAFRRHPWMTVLLRLAARHGPPGTVAVASRRAGPGVTVVSRRREAPRAIRAVAVTIRQSIDCVEGDRKQIAVLLTEDGPAISFPKALLPKSVKAGDPLTLLIERDAEGTRELAADTRKVQDQLRKTDPGGDIRL
jgi:hypothetical protein